MQALSIFVHASKETRLCALGVISKGMIMMSGAKQWKKYSRS